MAENRELALVLKLVADQFQQELRNSQGVLSSFNTFIKDWRTQLTAAGTALFAVAKSTANFGEEMLKGAQKTGQTVQTFSALSHAAHIADLDNQQLIIGLKSLSQNMVEAQRQTGDGEALFRRLGVSAVDTAGKLRPTEDVLLDLADVFERSADGAGKTEAAVKLFGKAGVDLIPFLNMGRAGITELMAEAQRLGVVLSKENAEAANHFNDELKKLDAAAKGLTVSVGNAVIPTLTQMLQVIQQIGPAVNKAGQEMAGFSKQLSADFGKTGLGQKLMDLFSFMGLGHRKGEEPGANEQALLKALGLPPGGGSVGEVQTSAQGGGAAKPPIAEIADQQKLGKALLEIFLAQNRALDIQNKLAREAAQAGSEYFLAYDRKLQREKEDGDEQERLGRQIVERTQEEVRIREKADARERQGLVNKAQAWIDYDNQVGGSTELRYQHEMDLVRASLANQLKLTQDESAKLVIAWQNHDNDMAETILNRTQLTATEREAIERQSLTKLAAINQRYAGDIFEGWALGLQKYVQDTQSAFGFAQQMAQRTAQFMEQNFRQFFFDVMDQRITSLKDLFQSFSNFAKQIISQVMAQLATAVVLRGLTGGFGGFSLGGLFGGAGGAGGSLLGSGGFNLDGSPIRFASGGTVLGSGNRDTVRALLTPGEGVLNRKGMAALDQLNSGAAPAASGEANITVNIHNSGWTQAPQINYRRQFRGMIIDIIGRDPDLRQMFGRA